MNKNVHLGARLIFGAIFLIFGLNGFLKFLPTPPMSPEAGALLGAFAKTGYFFPMIKIIEIITALMILTNRLSALGTVLIFPILVGITTIHIFLNPEGLPMMIFIHILHGIIAYGYKDIYRPLFQVKSEF